jgi:hypothetical protein
MELQVEPICFRGYENLAYPRFPKEIDREMRARILYPPIYETIWALLDPALDFILLQIIIFHIRFGNVSSAV